MTLIKKLLIGLFVFIILSPLGLILPDHFRAGDAWGEWSPDELQKMIGYIPQGIVHLSDLWKAPMPDYSFKGWEDKGLAHLCFAYIIAAIVGMAVISAIIFLLGKMLARKED